jgi:hypothetical protein
MMKKKEDEGIRAVRDVRKALSAEFGNDPDRLVEHYLKEQERLRDRLLQPVPVAGAAGRDASRRR